MRKKILCAIGIILLVLWMAMIFRYSAQPAVQSTRESGRFVKMIAAALRWFGMTVDTYGMGVIEKIVRKTAHFMIYFVLGVLASNAGTPLIKRRLPLYAILFCLLYAASDELHQHFVPGRSMQAADVLLDTAGSSIGVGIWFAAAKFFTKYKKTIEKK